jgi:hypothetical protein
MTDKRDSNDEIRRLIPLRVTDDLTADEAALVDEEVRYSSKSKADLEAYESILDVLRDAGSETLPVEDRPSLWTKLEPKLGPAGRHRKQSRIQRWVPTWQLAAACLALFALTAVIEMRQDPKTLPFDNGNVMVDFNGAPAVRQAQPLMVPIQIPMLGVVVKEISPEIRQRLPISGDAGVLIAGVLRGSAAHQDGIVAGDLLLKVNGHAVDSITGLLHMLQRFKNGDEIQVELFRGGNRILQSLRLSLPEARRIESHPSKMRRFHEEAFQVATPNLAGSLMLSNLRSA